MAAHELRSQESAGRDQREREGRASQRDEQASLLMRQIQPGQGNARGEDHDQKRSAGSAALTLWRAKKPERVHMAVARISTSAARPTVMPIGIPAYWRVTVYSPKATMSPGT